MSGATMLCWAKSHNSLHLLSPCTSGSTEMSLHQVDSKELWTGYIFLKIQQRIVRFSIPNGTICSPYLLSNAYWDLLMTMSVSTVVQGPVAFRSPELFFSTAGFEEKVPDDRKQDWWCRPGTSLLESAPSPQTPPRHLPFLHLLPVCENHTHTVALRCC